MVIGALVIAALILLMFVAEVGSGWVWRGGHGAFVYCRPCDQRYPCEDLQMADRVGFVCPNGHYNEPPDHGFSLGTLTIATCAAFLAVAGVLLVTGVVPSP